MYRQIMVPLDGSRFAESALSPALTVSRITGAAVHLAIVEEPIPSFAYDLDDNVVREWSGKYLDKVVRSARDRTGGGLDYNVLSGHVVEALEAEAKACRADLVVMATHGRGVLTRAWLGSVTDAFLHNTSGPVLIVRPQEEEPPDILGDVAYSKVLIPLDGSEVSESVLDHALGFGALFGASYHLVRVVPFPMDVASPYLPATFQMNQDLVEEARSAAREYLEIHAERMRQRGLTVDVGVRVEAQAGHGILKEAEAQECRLIAMATHGRGGLSRAILGSATDKVLRGAHVPLLLHRYDPAA